MHFCTVEFSDIKQRNCRKTAIHIIYHIIIAAGKRSLWSRLADGSMKIQDCELFVMRGSFICLKETAG